MKKVISTREKIANKFLFASRIAVLIASILIFFPGFNPVRIYTNMSTKTSLLTCAISYEDFLGDDLVNILSRGNSALDEGPLALLSYMALLLLVAILVVVVGSCMSLGNLKLKKIGNWVTIGGAAAELGALAGIFFGYQNAVVAYENYKIACEATSTKVKFETMFQPGFYFYLVLAVVVLLLVVVAQCILPATEKGSKCEMPTKYKLFLMFLPFAVLCFLFSYLPLWGWRFAFFTKTYSTEIDRSSIWAILFGDGMGEFVGLKYFKMFVQDAAYRAILIRVLKNTLIMSGLGIATSWCPMAIAIFLGEIKNTKFVRVIQTITTIPNFISWVLVYAVALAIFSNDGFINTVFSQAFSGYEKQLFLEDPSGIWFKMLLWGMWKGVGWSAIVYVAALSGIDPQLYEAATVDGAGRFQKMWYISLPGLLPTYTVLLLLSIASILSNGTEQYLVFQNSFNSKDIEVLDLYVYNVGIANSKLAMNISLTTVVGMAKTIVSVFLLFCANGISKLFRGESIV